MNLNERLFKKVLIIPFHECWEWIGNKTNQGYGQFHFENRRWLAHRLIWTITKGPIPKNLFVCHSCDNPGCVRPNHLFIGSPKDNTQDMMKKGRGAYISHPRERNGRTILNEMQVGLIRSKYKPHQYKIKDLMKEFGVSRSCITKILYNKTWAL